MPKPAPVSETLSVRANFREEGRALKACWPGLVIGIVFQAIHIWAHNLVYYVAGKYRAYGGVDNRLVDLGFEAFPSIEDQPGKPSNTCLIVLMVIVFLFGFSVFIYGTEGIVKARFIQMMWRYLCVSILTITMRCVSFLSTVLPSPAKHCGKTTFNPPTISGIFSTGNMDAGCSDLIFSGHLMYAMLFGLAAIHYLLPVRLDAGPVAKYLPMLLVTVIWSLIVLMSYFIVAQRSHYTVDVVICAYTVPLAWVFFYHYIPRDPLDSRQKAMFGVTTPNMHKASSRTSSGSFALSASPRQSARISSRLSKKSSSEGRGSAGEDSPMGDRAIALLLPEDNEDESTEVSAPNN